jgi:hypothetical protein
MTPEQRSEAARKAAMARWAKVRKKKPGPDGEVNNSAHTLYGHRIYMAKERNFTLCIDARLLKEFLMVCGTKDETASAVLRGAMRRYVREWRRNVADRFNDDDGNDDLNPGYDDTADTGALRAEAAEARRKRLADEQRVADLKAETAKRLSELKTKLPA